MTLPLQGRVVALAETRQSEELAAMLAAEGATPLSYPLVAILDAPDPAPVAAWLRDLVAGRFTTVVFMTGEGIRRLLALAEREGIRDAVVAAFGKARTLARGPKPVRALREVGLMPSLVSEAPTTDGVIATLAKEPLAGQTVGVQFHGEDVPALTAAVTAAGATPVPVRPYVYAASADAEKVADLIGRMARGEVDLLFITSTPQSERLFEVAAERGIEAELRRGLERTAVASIGPVATEGLKQRGVRVDITPDHGFVMKSLVKLVARQLDGLPKRG